MKKLIVISMLAMSACTSRTPHGECVGLNGTEDPKLVYKYSAWNLFVGIVFIELIVPPIIVAMDGLKCPVAVK